MTLPVLLNFILTLSALFPSVQRGKHHAEKDNQHRKPDGKIRRGREVDLEQVHVENAELLDKLAAASHFTSQTLFVLFP